MVKTLISAGIMAFSLAMCNSNKHLATTGDCGIKLLLEAANFSLGDSLKLALTNETQSTIQVSEFSCLANTHISLNSMENDAIPINNKIKVNPDCITRYISIEPGETKHLTYDYTLATLYKIEQNHQYKIRISYEGNLKSKSGNYRCSNVLFEGLVKIVE